MQALPWIGRNYSIGSRNVNRSVESAQRGEDQEQSSRVVIPWLVRLRWMSLVALAAAAWAATAFWGARLPTLPLVGLLGTMAVTNAALAFELRSAAPRRSVMGGALMLDAGLLTGVLYLVGGPLNPFSIVYLVGITMAAVALGRRWAVSLAIVSNVAYGLTFAYNRPFEFSDPSASSGILALHLYGMWVALAAAAGLIAYFVSRIAEALEQRERELTISRAAAARSERLAALFALGAGAAHELATPLSTIRTAAIELERSLAGHRGTPPEIGDYVGLMRREVDRCTTVLDGLSGRAAPASAADIGVHLPRLIDDVKLRLGEALSQRLDVMLPIEPKPITAPAEPLCQVLVALLRNAFDASAIDQRVALRVDQQPGFRAEVTDRGRGMAPEESSRAGEPFFTTKPAGAGLGLGLFLARAFADQMGGSVRWRSAVGEGTSVILELPA
jgi:two-component system, sensor histidine kinase RegB